MNLGTVVVFLLLLLAAIAAQPIPSKQRKMYPEPMRKAERYTIIKNALELGFTGLGVASTFIHVDTRGTTPVSWLY